MIIVPFVRKQSGHDSLFSIDAVINMLIIISIVRGANASKCDSLFAGYVQSLYSDLTERARKPG